MMYIHHNPLNINDLLVQGSNANLQYNPQQFLAAQTTPTSTLPYQQQAHLQPQFQIQAQKTLANQANNGYYTFAPAQSTPNAQNPQRNNRSTSASSLSSVSSTSSTSSSIYSTNTQPASTDAQSLLSNSSQNQSFNKNIPLGNSLYPSYNFAYYNPQLMGTMTGAPGSAQNSTGSKVNSSLGTFQSPSDNFVYKTPTSTSATSTPASSTAPAKATTNTNVLSTLDPNYQINSILPSTTKTSTNTNSNTTANATTANLNPLNFCSSSMNLNPQQNFYNTSHQQYKHTTPSSLAFLPSSSDIYYSTDASRPGNAALGLNLTPSYTELTFGAKSLQLPAFNSKNQFSVGINMKRKRRFKKPPELRNVLPKNSLMLLHEYRPNVEYRFVCQSGPIHRPMFTMCVDINEHKFEGTGKTKKDARMQAAEKALEFLIQHPEYIQKALPGDKEKKQPSENDPEIENNATDENNPEENVENESEERDAEDREPLVKRLKTDSENAAQIENNVLETKTDGLMEEKHTEKVSDLEELKETTEILKAETDSL